MGNKSAQKRGNTSAKTRPPESFERYEQILLRLASMEIEKHRCQLEDYEMMAELHAILKKAGQTRVMKQSRDDLAQFRHMHIRISLRALIEDTRPIGTSAKRGRPALHDKFCFLLLCGLLKFRANRKAIDRIGLLISRQGPMFKRLLDGAAGRSIYESLNLPSIQPGASRWERGYRKSVERNAMLYVFRRERTEAAALLQMEKIESDPSLTLLAKYLIGENADFNEEGELYREY